MNEGPVATGGATVDSTPTVVLVQGGGGSTIASVPMSGGTGPAWTCSYIDPGGLIIPKLRGPVTPEAGERYLLSCYDATGASVYFGFVTYDPANPAGGALAAQRAAQLALAQLTIPDPSIATNPPPGSPQLVGVRTFLWLDNWAPVSTSATLGGVTATVTATPTSLRFDTGDGASVTCTEGGAAYDPAAPPAGASGDCSHVYLDRSTVEDPTGTYPLTATVTFTVTWSATDGQSGSLEDQVRTASMPLQVIEAQAVVR